MKKMAMAFALALLGGCFTLDRTEMPQVQMSHAPTGKDIKVGVAGFAATITEYIPVYGYGTMYVDHGPHYGPHGRRWYGGGHYETVTTETLVPQVKASQAFITRAQTLLEDAGYLVRAPQLDYTVEVTFEGPFQTSGEKTAELLWMFCSVLSAEYTTQTWNAKLRIYDVKTGRVLHSHDYSQKFQDLVWSPIFFFGLAGYTENTANFVQSWCLTALTDRTIADATAFLSRR